LQLLAGALIAVAGAVVLAGALSVARMMSAAAGRTSLTLSTLARQAFDEAAFEQTTRYALAAAAGADAPLIGFDATGARGMLAAPLRNDRRVAILPPPGGAESIAASRDGGHILPVGDDGIAKLWSADSFGLHCTFLLYGTPPGSCATTASPPGTGP